MSLFMQWLRHGWLPLLLLTAFVLQRYAWLDFPFPAPVKLSPVLLGVALALAVFFKSSRLAYAATLILAFYLALDAVPWLRQESLFSLSLALVSLNIALVAYTSDRNPLSGFGLLLLFAALGQGVGLYLLQSWPNSFSWLMPLTLPYGGGIQFDLAAQVFVCAILLLLVKVSVKPEATGFGLLACTLLLYLVRDPALPPGQFHLAASISSLLLTFLVLHSAYELAFRDELTGIPSRRAYNRYLLTLGRHYMIAVIDIDHFKKLNDRHGHRVGDQVLRMVAGKIARYGGGRAFRYGGEEFVVVFRGRDREKALNALERMREKIAGYPLKLRSAMRDPADNAKARRRRGQGGGRAIKTTVSVGLAGSRGNHRSPEAVLEAADRALYRAKRGGRNRVCTQA
ncbi:GGDEF domain-containing protein [Microbulbifer thermotolerans]|uniref:GGDEF domain-containing protein n=1 Tax=Microbulbifer thermotolerans TaxID=252514 RepID=UPI0022497ED4|nr:GGDEF domain-containing protein [Microbulbifer thermotolerans]MCX2794315.1 GGDEF domain-containing protein [Microbulbifer thermotolerans]